MVGLSLVTMVFAALSAISALLLLLVVALDARAARIDGGINRFQRHIDALSPQARTKARIHGTSNPDEWYR